MSEHILVIKLGALGDFVLAFSAFAAIRAHHPGARVTLLTTAPYAALGRRSPWFDAVAIDARPRLWQLRGLCGLRRQLRGQDLVYDLQTSSRSGWYFWLAGRPAWSGIGRGCRFPHRDRDRDRQHTLERQRGQLRDAGIDATPPPDLTWLTHGPAPHLPRDFAMLVPGAAPHRPEKRWPAENFASIGLELMARGITPVVIGAAAEREIAGVIQRLCPGAIDLTGQTDLPTVCAIARRARYAVGNDTGPMHLAAAVGCPCVVLFGPGSDPALTAPRGPNGAWPIVLRADILADLPVARVAAALG